MQLFNTRGTLLFYRVRWLLWRSFRSGEPLHGHLLRLVRRHPHKQCVVEVESGRSLTFAQFNAHANAYAHLFSKNLNIGADDVVALFMENGISFFATWIGLSKLGVVTAWINTNLKGDPLGHSIRVARCKAVLTTPTLLPTLRRTIAQGHLDANLPIFLVSADGTRVTELAPTTTTAADAETAAATLQEYALEDTAEEPPKPPGLTIQSAAAVIRHYRFYLMGMGCGMAFGIRASDRIYLTLPMYHSAGGILGTSQVIVRGCTACIRTKFSATNFWKDCTRFECTVSQYIGEICRYLLAQPASPADRAHPIRADNVF
uniref:Long-chain-fatty-acid--CoA ligase n=1 Tax=Globodera pallida TaxID=36090 RepID=A0A183CMA3_GLOPA